MNPVYLPPALFVTWQNRPGSTRKIYPVGRLLRLPDGTYEFTYVHGALEAQQDGFAPFLTFPHLRSTVRSADMPPFFTNRVMTSGRPDYAAHVRAFALAPTASREEILARSGGRRATDTVEVFAEPLRTEGGDWEAFFLVRSLRHVPGSEDTVQRLSPGERLYPMLDRQNPRNVEAIALRTEDNRLIGYLPDYLTREVAQLLLRSAAVDMRVERVNPPPSPVHYRVLARCTMHVDEGVRLFRSQRLEPLAADATRLDGPVSAVA